MLFSSFFFVIYFCWTFFFSVGAVSSDSAQILCDSCSVGIIGLAHRNVCVRFSSGHIENNQRENNSL